MRGAEEGYRVVIAPVTLEVDIEATEKLRKEHNKQILLQPWYQTVPLTIREGETVS